MFEKENLKIKEELEKTVSEMLQSMDKVEDANFYNELTSKNLLCGLKKWVRVLKEVRELNQEFISLRTHVAAISNIVGVLHFLIFPADGPFADKPLCGRILIPHTYPNDAPVVQLLTRTGRYNVDAYHRYGDKSKLAELHSTLCFDILRSVEKGGIWKPEFTISCLIASLMQALVCIKVPQEDGDEVEEFVTMELLKAINKEVNNVYSAYEKVMPPIKEIRKIKSEAVESKKFILPDTIQSPKDDKFIYIPSEPIRIQVKDEEKSQCVYTIGFDLSGLKLNPQTIFSLLLTNNIKDYQGKKKETVLVRNGVTATAAKKLRNQEMKWFYHGKPMNQSDLKLIVTIGYDQFCVSYLDGDEKFVHGDCPVSYLTPAEIGDVSKETFYLVVLLRNKDKGPQVTVKTFLPDTGYLHPIYGGIPQDKIEVDKNEEKKVDDEYDGKKTKKVEMSFHYIQKSSGDTA